MEFYKFTYHSFCQYCSTILEARAIAKTIQLKKQKFPKLGDAFEISENYKNFIYKATQEQLDTLAFLVALTEQDSANFPYIKPLDKFEVLEHSIITDVSFNADYRLTVKICSNKVRELNSKAIELAITSDGEIATLIDANLRRIVDPDELDKGVEDLFKSYIPQKRNEIYNK